ncbi:5-oxoprolinase subunit PxpB [Photobacterium rosenbergii]|uniref:5-oxoprolinase subunit PxpB n=1 Tax=Photobacterium rosenbergii TaxID=294936 RepID=UPI001C99F824|nr:5-oxoprolinase subunit PxpB [Photobacterium rosenbergii]MBY5943960.1 5-oxoprolinase subunit PxpB [Photobacterium rosenbergii]
MFKVEAVSECNAIVYFGDQIDLSLTPKISRFVAYLQSLSHPALIEVIPSYTSVLIQYRPDLLTYEQLVGVLTSLSVTLEQTGEVSGDKSAHSDYEPRLISLPVYYGAEVGPDLAVLAQAKGLSVDEVIERHSQQVYTVCAIGFAPGFAFLASVDESIAAPRHTEPRKWVPAGSVGIANQQTAVYPNDSPGGWQIIGNCPQILFQPDNSPMTPFQVGDQVTFTPISKDAFLAQGGQIWSQWK